MKYTYDLKETIPYGMGEQGLVIIPDQIHRALKQQEHRWGTSFPALRVKHSNGHPDPRVGEKVRVRVLSPDYSHFVAIGA
jgi:hypothetical protein